MYVDFTYSHVITDLVKDTRDKVVGYRLENGDVVSKGEVVDLAKQTAIKGMSKEVYNQKDEFLKSIPSHENSNLLDLPVIE